MRTTARAGRLRTTTATLATATALLALTACGDGSSSGPPSSGGTSGGTSPTASGSGSPSASADAVTPADGPAVRTSTFTAHVPTGWRVDDSYGDYSITAFAPGAQGVALEIVFGNVPAHGDTPPDAQLVSEAVSAHPGWSTQRPARDTSARLDGQPVVSLTGPVSGGTYSAYLTTVRADHQVTLEVQAPYGGARLARLVAAVAASWTWR
ncbi:MAG: hypothetical protein ACXVW1_07700 [Nocardioides sp.]